MGGFMSVGSFIIYKNSSIASTIDSLQDVDQIHLITNESSTQENIKILEASMTSCCGSIVESKENQNYIEKSYEKLSWIHIKENYFKLDNIFELFKKYEYIHIGFSGSEFESDYIKRHVKILSSYENIAAYSDYLQNDHYKCLEYIHPMINNKQEIKNVVIKTESIESKDISNDDLFLCVTELYKKGVIRHIPCALYKS